MFVDLQQKFGEWVLELLEYDTAERLMEDLEKTVVQPAVAKANDLLRKKAQKIMYRDVDSINIK